MAVKTKCPSCDAELELPDDPRVIQMQEQLVESTKVIARLSEQVEKLGGRVPPEVKTEQKNAKKLYDGIFFDIEQEAEEAEGGHDKDD